MKHIKLLFSINCVLFFANNAKTQNTFLDSSSYYTFFNAPSLSEGLSFASYTKELIVLDSIKPHGEYYSVSFVSDETDFFSHKYFLKVKNDTVFYTGTLFEDSGDTFKVKNLMIYNFSLNVGDTLKIKHLESGLNIDFLVASVKNLNFQDNIIRKTQYLRALHVSSTENYSYTSPLFASQGFGSNFGLLPFNIIKRNSPFRQQLISACNKEKNTIYSANASFDLWNINDYCDENEVIKLIDTIRKMSTNQIYFQNIEIYPNPVTKIINAKGITSGNALIYNSQGQLVVDAPFENQIDVSQLKNGLYQLIISHDNKTYTSKFLKIE